MNTSDIELVMTCPACPEQYDAFFEGAHIGYLRLRHGLFSVRCPDADGEVVFSSDTHGDGEFQQYEREKYLNLAKQAIIEYIKRNPLYHDIKEKKD